MIPVHSERNPKVRYLRLLTLLLILTVTGVSPLTAAGTESLEIKGILRTETDQAAPNGFTIQARTAKKVVEAVPERTTGAFSLKLDSLEPGTAINLIVKDPMGKPVDFAEGTMSQILAEANLLASGSHDAGTLGMVLPPQEPLEAFAMGGRVFGTDEKPLPKGFTMYVTTFRGDRTVREEIEDGKFALIFLDLQGQFRRIQEGDMFRFEVVSDTGTKHPVVPDSYRLTRTDIANSSVSTLRFTVDLE